jgi:hypothetical protein
MQDDRNNIATITRHSRSNVKDKDIKRMIRIMPFDLCLYLYNHQNKTQVGQVN